MEFPPNYRVTYADKDGKLTTVLYISPKDAKLMKVDGPVGHKARENVRMDAERLLGLPHFANWDDFTITQLTADSQSEDQQASDKCA